MRQTLGSSMRRLPDAWPWMGSAIAGRSDERMGGAIRIEDLGGSGARFALSLPASAGATSTMETSAERGTGRRSHRADRDDNPNKG